MRRKKGQIGYSSLSDQEVFGLEDRYMAEHYKKLKFAPRSAKGVWVYNVKGERFFDCLAAYSAANQGHDHPHIAKAVMKAIRGGYSSVISGLVYTDSVALFAEKVANLLPQLGPRFGNRGNKVLFKNGGVESYETAVKMSRYDGYLRGIPDGQQEIIVFRHNFHGRTNLALAASTNRKYKEGFGVRQGGFAYAEFGNAESVERLVTPNTCAILVEPMQGEGGMNIPPVGFLSDLRKIADENRLLLIFDEIQVGLGRTGKMFCFEHEGVVPDGIILGKALSGGFMPVSAFVTNKALMDMAFWPGRDGSTFGGYPLACVAGIAALEVIEKEGLVENSRIMGALLKERIIEEVASNFRHVKEVRGCGLFIGIEIEGGNAFSFCQRLLELGLLVNDSHGHTLRISPPLILTEWHVDYMVRRLKKVLVD
jgi:ornithine--oxo-acid transaminase